MLHQHISVFMCLAISAIEIIFVALKLQGILHRFGEAKVPTFKTLIKITTFIAVTNREFKLYR